jgi:hypothetical protein
MPKNTRHFPPAQHDRQVGVILFRLRFVAAFGSFLETIGQVSRRLDHVRDSDD